MADRMARALLLAGSAASRAPDAAFRELLPRSAHRSRAEGLSAWWSLGFAPCRSRMRASNASRSHTKADSHALLHTQRGMVSGYTSMRPQAPFLPSTCTSLGLLPLCAYSLTLLTQMAPCLRCHSVCRHQQDRVPAQEDTFE